MHVLLDLYGVLLDSERLYRGYRDRLAAVLSSQFGGSPDEWRRAHDAAFVAYVQRVNEADWDARAWADIVDELDARNLEGMFASMGVGRRPDNLLAFARDLEREAMASVDARFPDARTGIERLRAAGHRVYVATGGSETAEAALRGAGLGDVVDGLFTGHSQKASKARARYWEPIPSSLGALPEEVLLVDDRLDYLEAAASIGIVALLLDRKGRHRPEEVPPYVRATFRNLAGLPHFIERLGAGQVP